MDWSFQKVFGIVSGAVLGAMLGVLIATMFLTVTTVILFPLAIIGITLANFAVSQNMMRRLTTLIADRSRLLAAGTVGGESAPARVHRVFPRVQMVAATMSFPASAESARLALLHVLPGTSAPRTVYALLPARYGIQPGAGAAVVLDRDNPDIAVLDDRVSPATLQAIGADPRWTTTPVPSMFVRQGGRATVIAAAIGLVAGFVALLPLILQ